MKQTSWVKDIDSTPTSGSTNLVTSGGVYTGLAGKQNTLTSPMAYLGSNITGGAANDTRAFWQAKGTGYCFFDQLNQLNGQPNQWGFLVNYVNGAEIYQEFHASPNRDQYKRGANGNTTAMPEWTQIVLQGMSTDLKISGNYVKQMDGVDYSKSDNGVSTTLWPYYDFVDSANRIGARFEAVVNPNGSNGFKLYARNYNTSGEQVAQKGLDLTIAKDGSGTWHVDDADSFSNAIGAAKKAGDTMTGDLVITKSNNYPAISFKRWSDPDNNPEVIIQPSAGSGEARIGFHQRINGTSRYESFRLPGTQTEITGSNVNYDILTSKNTFKDVTATISTTSVAAQSQLYAYVATQSGYVPIGAYFVTASGSAVIMIVSNPMINGSQVVCRIYNPQTSSVNIAGTLHVIFLNTAAIMA